MAGQGLHTFFKYFVFSGCARTSSATYVSECINNFPSRPLQEPGCGDTEYPPNWSYSLRMSEEVDDSQENENVNDTLPTVDETPNIVNNVENQENTRYCWVCYASDEDDETAPWVKPCKCRGTTKWVHHSCLQRWVDEKQRGNSTVKVNCPQCGVAYLIAFPNMGQLMWFLGRIDSFIYKACPFVAAGVVVGAIYWTAMTYGAITVMQVVGYEEGMELMEQAAPLVLIVGLPSIPVFLILGKMVRWEDKVLHMLRSSVRKLPLLKYILPAFRVDEEPQRVSTTAVISDPINATRVMCGALSLPTIASIVGRLFFTSVPDNLTQTLLGGAAFLAVKGIFKVYYKQQQHVMQARRKIIDYQEAASSPRVNESAASPPDSAS